MRAGSTAILLLFLCSSAAAQDPFLRNWELAQREAPRTIGSTARIAAANEPGTPMVVHGRVFQGDGVTPAAGVTVFAYQTDRAGEYNVDDRPGYRLKGWARTDAQGRFVFHTIRPGSYPSGRTPAHIHIIIQGPRLSRRWTPDVMFSDDPYLNAAQRRQSAQAGKFGSVRPVVKRGAVEHVEFNIRITESGKF